MAPPLQRNPPKLLRTGGIVTKLIRAVAVIALGATATAAYAFHSGGVAACEGCHSMHSPASASFLLVGSDQSSACLTCHASADTAPTGYHVMSLGQPIPTERTPGGDFAWLLESYAYGSGTTEAGQEHGHNIIAADFGYVADTRPSHAVSPGGSFPAASLGCHSCHDPHGKYRRLSDGSIATTGAPIKGSGSPPGPEAEPTATEAVGVYRHLAGNGYSTRALGTIGFPGVPAAKAPSTYNQSEATNQVRVAYGVATTSGHTTWGNWCGTCHAAMHSSGNYVHPIDRELGRIADLYNSYVKSGDLTGTQPSAFLSLVPFVENTGDYTVLAAHASSTLPTSAGPSPTDQVSCISCHRTHASPFPHKLRWFPDHAFITRSGTYPASDDGGPTFGRTPEDWQAAYYDRPATRFATYQRVLCNKCHAKD